MNIALLLKNQSEQLPDKAAVVCNDNKVTFMELEEEINRCANYLVKQGIEQGTKVLLFIPPSIELPVVTFALFKIGAIPIFIDPGMGLKSLRKAVSEVAPDAMIAVPLIRKLSRIFRNAFKSVRVKLDYTAIREASKDESCSFEEYDAPEDEMAAILFTSGGTGKPKGVVYTHKIFVQQTKLLQEMYSLTPDDVDCPCFSLFSFFTISMGLTSYVPRMDASHPAKTDPSGIVRNLQENNTTFAAGSPAIWIKVADYCLLHDIQLPALKHLVMFGAPVDIEMHEKWQKILPNGSTYTPYGATESLPISNISGEYILENTADLTLGGAGVCVGKAVPSVEVRIYNEDEIIVSGDTTTKEYYNEPDATLNSKLTIDGKLWHKVGDVGTIDEEGRIWFWGRTNHVIKLGNKKLYPVPCQTVFNQHEKIKRTALIGPSIDGEIVPSLAIELHDGKAELTDSLLEELIAIRDSYEFTKPIKHFFVKKSFPVDVRHNIKIDNIALCDWAEKIR